jgi:pimeloyl-ACP methyl ester carboxylesterase
MSDPAPLTVRNHTLAAQSYNADKPGTPLVFIHGFGLPVHFWATCQTPVVTAERRWYALSLPGHFPAQPPPGFQREDLTASCIADLLTGGIRKLTGGQPAILVGHSTGGFASLAVAARAPELVQSVICIAGFAQGRWIGNFGQAQSLVRSGVLGRWVMKANFGSQFRNHRRYSRTLRETSTQNRDARRAMKTDPALNAAVADLLPVVRQMDRDILCHYLAQMVETDISAWLPSITAPTLVLHGDADYIVSPSQSDLIAARVPDATHITLGGVGHLPMFEQAEKYHRILTQWIEAHP